MTRFSRLGLAAATAATAAGVVLGGSAIANAATSTSGTATTTTATAAAATGNPDGTGSGSVDTPVTGDELAKVAAAVKAKDAAVTVTSVQKDPDGSYDVFATKAGANIRYDVTADLKTITEGRGGRSRSADTPVTGDELAKVTAAMKAKDAAVTVTSVQKDPDGSYDVSGTKAGAKVVYDVSADLQTFTQRTAGVGPNGTSNDATSQTTPNSTS
jgi:hypothetical protein